MTNVRTKVRNPASSNINKVDRETGANIMGNVPSKEKRAAALNASAASVKVEPNSTSVPVPAALASVPVYVLAHGAPRFEHHPDTAEWFPPLRCDEAVDEYGALASGMKRDGQIEPITIYERKIIDGRTREGIATKNGLDLKFRLFEDIQKGGYTGNHFDFACAQNSQRRSMMTLGQRDCVAEKEVTQRQGRPKKDADREISQQEAADRHGTSARNIQRITRIRKEDPEGYAAVWAGEADPREVEKNIIERRKPEEGKNKAPRNRKPEASEKAEHPIRRLFDRLCEATESICSTQEDQPKHGKMVKSLWAERDPELRHKVLELNKTITRGEPEIIVRDFVKDVRELGKRFEEAIEEDLKKVLEDGEG